MSIFSTDLHDPRVIDLIRKSNLSFQACQPLAGEKAPKAHHWIPNNHRTDTIPLEECNIWYIKQQTLAISNSYKDLVILLKLKPNYIKGYIWAISKVYEWGLISVKSNLMSSTELWKFIMKLSIYLVFNGYEVIHGNITGLHVYAVPLQNKPILMTPNRFVPRPRGSEIIRAWCWYIARGHQNSDKFINLLREQKKNKLIVKLWLLGAIQDCIKYPDYYLGDKKAIVQLWREI
jgi:hypothetical protein